jgi:polyisoprenoid-binding protein YceI
MYIKFSLNILLFAALLVFVQCADDKPLEKSQPVDTSKVAMLDYKAPSKDGAVVYTVIEGTVNWAAKKTLGQPHVGELRVSEGEMLVNGGQPISGKITMDMNSIVVTNLTDGGEKRELESHLKHSDFFGVDKFPTGTFEFEEVVPNTTTPDFNWVILGKLTLKGKTNSVNIPARLKFDGDMLVAESPSFQINRTKWGINFQSSVLGTAKDKLIEDAVVLSLRLKALPKK